MKINILEHHYVPEHIKLDQSEVEKLAESLEYDIKDLPKIRSNDPVAKQISAEEGDVIKIIRNSDTAGTFVTYRIVE